MSMICITSMHQPTWLQFDPLHYFDPPSITFSSQYFKPNAICNKQSRAIDALYVVCFFVQCCAACSEKRECSVAVWSSKQGRCYLKSGKNKGVYLDGAKAFVPSRSGSSSWSSPKKQCGRQEPDADNTGNDFANGYAATVGDCCNMCRNDSRCVVAVFDSNQLKCYLKNAKGGYGFLQGATPSTCNKSPQRIIELQPSSMCLFHMCVISVWHINPFPSHCNTNQGITDSGFVAEALPMSLPG
ncbi:Aste57867_4665 [Aphanomyces stellatus]|uniref:Aste57867_4665 protein n=1 Tax=Aphanomyces stellatus TaxID=120398 RepID=A0A485KBR1_9STRA|nr:hypothetical protein As57867_004652 [Aphanomyces stellatus]VFT81768.1 Aste57867_4665 [Aphanomyces stellatus]